jgi:hypothetical protein
LYYLETAVAVAQPFLRGENTPQYSKKNGSNVVRDAEV